jgi:hypothetical protein
MIQPDPNQQPMGFFHTMLPPHFVGGVAPSRHDVALAAYLEKQAAQRAAVSGEQRSSRIAMRLWGTVDQVARRLADAFRRGPGLSRV